MKTNEITKFLADILLQNINQDGVGYLDSDGTLYITTKQVTVWVKFSPMNLIEHAWMVEEAIAKMENTAWKYAQHLAFVVDADIIEYLDDWVIEWDDIFDIANATPSQRSHAAVRTLGTDEQIERLL